MHTIRVLRIISCSDPSSQGPGFKDPQWLTHTLTEYKMIDKAPVFVKNFVTVDLIHLLYQYVEDLQRHSNCSY